VSFCNIIYYDKRERVSRVTSFVEEIAPGGFLLFLFKLISSTAYYYDTYTAYNKVSYLCVFLNIYLLFFYFVRECVLALLGRTT